MALKRPINDENEYSVISLPEEENDDTGQNRANYDYFTNIYAENIKIVGQSETEIIKALQRGTSAKVVLLQAVEVIDRLTGKTDLQKIVKGIYETVYAENLHDVEALHIELQATQNRLAMLKKANTESQLHRNRVNSAIVEHEKAIARLTELIKNQ